VFIRCFQPFSPYLFSPGGGYSTEAITTSDTTSYVSVGELFDSSSKTFDADNFNILMKYISGDPEASIDDINTLANSVLDSAEMRAFTMDAGSYGTKSYEAKANGQDICVRLGGLDWQVMYLSKDKHGKSILTLWLDNNVQDAWVGRSATEGQYYGFLDGGLYSDYSANWYTDFVNAPTPSNMYGASYVNAVTLNNGGYYSINTTTISDYVEKRSDSVFALFTMEQFGLTQYMVTPRDVSWQESGQKWGSSPLANENWDDSNTTGWTTHGHYGSIADMITNPYYDAWADSYIWLPSQSETGRTENGGLWKTSKAQKETYDGTTDSTEVNVGTKPGVAYARTLLRTGGGAGFNISALPSYGNVGWDYGNHVHASNAVRPALHLNLNLIAKELFSVSVGEIYNSSNKTVNQDNYNILKKYITGKTSPTASDINTLATNITDASEIRSTTISAGTAGSTAYKAKTNGQDIVVTLGGLKWQAVYLSQDKLGNSILTLWLDGVNQSAWDSRSPSEGEYFGYREGLLYSDWSANWNSMDISSNPSNMYSTSYINAVTLNNGGTYATSTTATTTASKSSSNAFALFTMPTYGLTQYLVTPRNVSWQESQSAVSTTNVTFNYPNEGWSTDTSNDGFFVDVWGECNNYASRAGSDSWADNYLWLPSATEAGYDGDHAGIWQSSITQRMNLAGKLDGIGSVDVDSGYASSWLRSGHFGDGSSAYSICSVGAEPYANTVSDSRVVRPCLHLNLTAMENAVSASVASVSEESSETTLNINKLNTNIDMIPIDIGSRGSVKKERLYK